MLLRARIVFALNLFSVSLVTCHSAYAQFTSGSSSLDPESTRSRFLKIIDRPRVPLAPELRPGGSSQGLTATHFTFATEANERVPGIIIGPEKAAARRPAVILLHGTGDSKEGMLDLAKGLAVRGFLVAAIDGRYHGERSKTGYDDAILRAYKTGKEHPFLYDTVWDVMRLIDYLETRDDVDPKRIGLMGISKGGMETYLAAATDSRIAVAVPCISVQSFRWALDNNSWQARVGTIQPAVEGAARDARATLNAEFVRTFYDRVVPGIYSIFDGPAMLPLIAPRPLMVINGDSDSLTPLPGVMLAANSASEAYAKAGAKEKFVLKVEKNTGHSVNGDSVRGAIDWFVSWLKPSS
jgi:pimeloyl-ACP methyl ester carboxylesterase